MRKLIIAATAALCVAGVGTSFGEPTRVDDPTAAAGIGLFTDDDGNAGYVEVDDDGAVRACNENPDATPAGDSLTGWAYVNPNGGEPTNGAPTYGNDIAGADDYDGDSSAGGGGEDCPPPGNP